MLRLLLLFLCWAPQQLDLAADTDRNRQITFSKAEQEAEEDGESVLILNNCDNDNDEQDQLPDNLDEKINGLVDRRDLEPVILRLTEGTLDTSTKVELVLASPANNHLPLQNEIKVENRFRVFDRHGHPILGPKEGKSHRLTAEEIERLNHAAIAYHVEGLHFRVSADLILKVDGRVINTIVLETAPFILTPHSQSLKDSFVVESGLEGEEFTSKRYVHDFTKICDRNGVHSRLLSDQSGDTWIQDECSWGYTETCRQTMPVVLHMLRKNAYGIDSTLASKVQKMVAHNVGYFKAFDYPPVITTLDFGGNLEVTPPTRKFPFGRIYYGSIKSKNGEQEYYQRKINEGYETFFKRQGVQKPIDLCTDWLMVGHVDEVVTFVPQKKGKMKLLIASPKLGLKILRSIQDEQKKSGTPFTFNGKYYSTYGLSTIERMLAQDFQGKISFTKYNNIVDRKLFGYDHKKPDSDSIKGILMNELELDEEDVIEVPVLYRDFGLKNKFAAVAQTPALVNLYSMDRDLIVPNPFIEQFSQHFEDSMEATGKVVHWVDDWDLYHVGLGEVHCGSNARRSNFQTKWWLK